MHLQKCKRITAQFIIGKLNLMKGFWAIGKNGIFVNRLLPPTPTSLCSILEPWGLTRSIRPDHFLSRIWSLYCPWSTRLFCLKLPVSYSSWSLNRLGEVFMTIFGVFLRFSVCWAYEWLSYNGSKRMEADNYWLNSSNFILNYITKNIAKTLMNKPTAQNTVKLKF